MNFSKSKYYVYIKPVIKNPIVRTYSGLFFSIIAVIFFSIFAIRPTISTILSLQKDIEEQQKILSDLSNKSVNLETGIQNYNKIDPQTLSKLNTLVPSKLTLTSLINEISTLATQNQASISGVQFQPFEIDNNQPSTTNEANLKEVVFIFNVTGPYERVVNVLNSLNKGGHLIIVESVSISKNESGISMIITAKTLY